MKTIICIGIIAVLIVIGGLLSYNLLDSGSGKLYDKLEGIEKNIYKDNWDNASDQFKTLSSNWEKEKNTWSMLIDHTEIDNISMNLSELNAYLDTKNQDEALSRLSLLKKLVRHIPEREAVKLRNIL